MASLFGLAWKTSQATDQIFVAGEHDEGLVDESVDVTQVLDGHIAFPLGLKQEGHGFESRQNIWRYDVIITPS